MLADEKGLAAVMEVKSSIWTTVKSTALRAWPRECPDHTP